MSPGVCIFAYRTKRSYFHEIPYKQKSISHRANVISISRCHYKVFEFVGNVLVHAYNVIIRYTIGQLIFNRFHQSTLYSALPVLA